MAKFEFGSIATNNEINVNLLNEEFEHIDWDSQEFYISKKIFHHDKNNEDDGDFIYRYGIEIIDMEEYDGTQKFYLNIYMIPLSEYLMNKVKGYTCVEYSGIEDVELAVDLMSEGFGIIFERAEYDYSNENDIDVEVLWDKAREIANIGANFVEIINSMRGFYLDECQNYICTTGWDKLNEYVYGGADWLSATLERNK